MIVTREQQEQIIVKFNETNPNTEQLVAFVQGMDAALKLIDEILKQKK